MLNYTYTVHIEPADEGGFNVFVPALPGCFTQGATYEEALSMVQEAIEGHLEALAKVGAPIPTESEPSETITATVRVRSPVAV